MEVEQGRNERGEREEVVRGQVGSNLRGSFWSWGIALYLTSPKNDILDPRSKCFRKNNTM